MIHYPIPPHWRVDEMTVAICASVMILVIAWSLAQRRIEREKKLMLSEPVDNVETLARAIASQIKRCEDAKDLNDAVRAIGRYEWFHMDDDNAKREAKRLKALLDERASEIYGVETIFS